MGGLSEREPIVLILPLNTMMAIVVERLIVGLLVHLSMNEYYLMLH